MEKISEALEGAEQLEKLKDLLGHDCIMEQRIRALEVGQSVVNVQVQTLCDQLKGLISALYWLGGILSTGLLGFFIWAVQLLLQDYRGL